MVGSIHRRHERKRKVIERGERQNNTRHGACSLSAMFEHEKNWLIEFQYVGLNWCLGFYKEKLRVVAPRQVSAGEGAIQKVILQGKNKV